MDFYSFKNHMQKLVVIDFPHHIYKQLEFSVKNNLTAFGYWMK